MMSSLQLSSKNCTTTTTAAPLDTSRHNKEKDKRRKKEPQHKHSPLTLKRSPLQSLNLISSRGIVTNISSTSSNASSAAISSSMSIEAPKGCLRFFLSSNPSCSSSSKSKPNLHHSNSRKCDNKSLPHKKFTSKSAPSDPTAVAVSSSSRSKSSKENHVPKNSTLFNTKKSPSFLYQSLRRKKPSFKYASKSDHLPVLNGKMNDCASGSAEFDGHLMRQFGENPYLGNHQKLNLSADSENCASVLDDLACGSDELGQNLKHLRQKEQQPLVSESFEDLQLSDLYTCTGHFVENKKPVAEGLGTSVARGNTPPVQASVSPEIPCGSSMLVSSAKTPSCYGAGHLLSGVTDRRKCKPKGILVVGNNDSSAGGKAGIFNTNSDGSEENVIEAPENSRDSLVPSPIEASMRWLLSPHNEVVVGDEDADLAKGCCNLEDSVPFGLPSSPLSCCKVPSALNENANYSGSSDTICRTGRHKTRIALLSPRRSTEFQGFLGSSSDKMSRLSLSAFPIIRTSCKTTTSGERRKYQYNHDRENSPLSINTLDSENVIRTPKSDSDSDRHVSCSWLNAKDDQKHPFESDFDSVSEILRSTSLSPRSQISMWDPPGLSFQFTDLALSSDSIDFSRLQKTLDNGDSWVGSYESQNMSPSLVRISWREGLVSRMFEMDEFDCCRCLSDEENDVDGHGPSHKVETREGYENNSFRSPEFLDHEPNIAGKGKSRFSSERSSSFAESMCIDGGGLAASGDSDWNLCYKNQLFQGYLSSPSCS